MGEDKKQYDFITETIKEKPKKKPFWVRLLITLMLGIVFGLAACVTFIFSGPYIAKYFQKEDTKVVTLSEDEVVETVAEAIETAEDKTKIQIGKSEKSDNDKEDKAETTGNQLEEVKAEANESSETEEETAAQKVKLEEDTDTDEEEISDNKEEADLPEETISEEALSDEGEDEQPISEAESVIDSIQNKEFGIVEYKQLYKELNSVAEKAYKSLATVTGVYSDIDWFSNPYESSNQTIGVIVADNGKELLIVAEVKAVLDADSIQVTFCDNAILPGKIKKSDPNTGLAIIGVNLDDISEETMEEIERARLGNSTLPSIVGNPVMAIGNPSGVVGAMSIGQITGNSYEKDLIDSNVHFITTDIYGSTNASGVLIDLEGKVLGIIYQDVTVTDVRNLIKAYGISDLKSKIEKISNGQDFAHLGVIGTDVTKEANEKYDVPLGAYIKEVEIDSPAMKEGLRSGDVIVKMGTTDIHTFEDFKEVMHKSQPGDLLMITVKRLGMEDYVDVSYEITLKTLE